MTNIDDIGSYRLEVTWQKKTNKTNHELIYKPQLFYALWPCGSMAVQLRQATAASNGMDEYHTSCIYQKNMEKWNDHVQWENLL